MRGYVRIKLCKYCTGLSSLCLGPCLHHKNQWQPFRCQRRCFKEIKPHWGHVVSTNRCPPSSCPQTFALTSLPVQSPRAGELQPRKAASQCCFSLGLWRKQNRDDIQKENGSNQDWVCCVQGSLHWGSSSPLHLSSPDRKTLEACLQPFLNSHYQTE